MALGGPPKEAKVDLFRFDHVHLGAPQKPASLSAIEAAHATEPDFERFRLRLEEYLNRRFNIPQDGHAQRWEKISPTEAVRTYLPCSTPGFIIEL